MATGRSDLDLVRSVLAGDVKARSELDRRLTCVRRMVASLAYKRGFRLADDEIDDVSQETQLAVLKKLGTFRGDAVLETWIYSFCALGLMSHGRKQRKYPRLLSDMESVSDDLIAPESRESQSAFEFGQLLRHLAPREAQVIDLRFRSHMTLDEIATELDVSPSTVKNSYYRAMNKLRQVMKGLEGEA